MAAKGFAQGISDPDRELAGEILKALGITMPVQKFTIEYEAGEMVKVSVVYHPTIAKRTETLNYA